MTVPQSTREPQFTSLFWPWLEFQIYMEPFPNNDIAIEILSRLPAKSLVVFKCTSKKWYSFVSDPSILRIHYGRVKGTRGLLAQDFFNATIWNSLSLVNLLTFTGTERGYTLKDNVLGFLPERVDVISSSNGILCCRSLVVQNAFTVYICNPLTRKWLQLRIKGDYKSTGSHLGLVLYPFRSSSRAASMFKLVNLKCSKNNADGTYSFDIYSSHTGKWVTSKEVCASRSRVYTRTVIFTNGWLHWATEQSQIIAFHVEKELSKIIDFPYPIRCWSCLGESENYVHCVYNNGTKIEVQVLKNYEEPTWEYKYSLDIPEFCQQHSSVQFLKYDNWKPLAFYDDVVYINAVRGAKSVILYDFRAKKIMNNCSIVKRNIWHYVVLQHCVSLVPLHEPISFENCHRNKNRN